MIPNVDALCAALDLDRVNGWGQTSVIQDRRVVRVSCRGRTEFGEVIQNGYVVQDGRFGEKTFYRDADAAACEMLEALAAWLVSDDEDRETSPMADQIISELEKRLAERPECWCMWDVSDAMDFQVTLFRGDLVIAQALLADEKPEDGLHVLDAQRSVIADLCALPTDAAEAMMQEVARADKAERDDGMKLPGDRPQ